MENNDAVARLLTKRLQEITSGGRYATNAVVILLEEEGEDCNLEIYCTAMSTPEVVTVLESAKLKYLLEKVKP